MVPIMNPRELDAFDWDAVQLNAPSSASSPSVLDR
jgi:hypothetical protein